MDYEIKNIKQIRKVLGLTQAGFAKEAGVSQSLIAKIEAEKIDPTYSKVQKIFEALDRLNKKKEISAREIMQRKVITVKTNERVEEIIKIMRKKAISQVLVVDGKKTVGVVAEKDILDKIDKDLNSLTAKDMMVEPPPVISEDTKMSVLTSLIRYYSILIVAKKGEVTGVITKYDIIGKMI